MTTTRLEPTAVSGEEFDAIEFLGGNPSEQTVTPDASFDAIEFLTREQSGQHAEGFDAIEFLKSTPQKTPEESAEKKSYLDFDIDWAGVGEEMAGKLNQYVGLMRKKPESYAPGIVEGLVSFATKIPQFMAGMSGGVQEISKLALADLSRTKVSEILLPGEIKSPYTLGDYVDAWKTGFNREAEKTWSYDPANKESELVGETLTSPWIGSTMVTDKVKGEIKDTDFFKNLPNDTQENILGALDIVGATVGMWAMGKTMPERAEKAITPQTIERIRASESGMTEGTAGDLMRLQRKEELRSYAEGIEKEGEVVSADVTATELPQEKTAAPEQGIGDTQKTELKTLGYSDAEIGSMRVSDVSKILSEARKYEIQRAINNVVPGYDFKYSGKSDLGYFFKPTRGSDLNIGSDLVSPDLKPATIRRVVEQARSDRAESLGIKKPISEQTIREAYDSIPKGEEAQTGTFVKIDEVADKIGASIEEVQPVIQNMVRNKDARISLAEPKETGIEIGGEKYSRIQVNDKVYAEGIEREAAAIDQVTATQEINKKRKAQGLPEISPPRFFDKESWDVVEAASTPEVRNGSGRWREPMKKYWEYTDKNPDATADKIKAETGLSDYQIDTIETVVNQNKKIESIAEEAANLPDPSMNQVGNIVLDAEAYRGVFDKFMNLIDVRYKWEKIGSPEVGFAVQNMYSVRSLYEEQGLHRGKQNKKLFGGDKTIAPDVVLGWENPKEVFDKLPPEIQEKIRPAVDDLGKFIKDGKEKYAERGVDVDFKQRVLDEIDDLVTKAENTADVFKLMEARKALEQSNFTHIPLMWFESRLAGADATGRSRAMDLLVTHKRKTMRIQDLVDSGAIERSDIHPLDIIASYSRRMGRDMALLDIRDAALKEGLAVRMTKDQIAKKRKGIAVEPPNGFVEAPRGAGVLKDTYMHPMLAGHIENMLKFHEGRTKWDKFMAMTKMAAFYNPLFLPMYDIIQQSMLRGPLNLYKAVPVVGQVAAYAFDRNFRKAIKDVWTRSPDYIEAMSLGMASKPFNISTRSWRQMLENAKKTKGEKYARLLQDMVPHKGLQHIYELSFDIAWKLDETIRMDTYNWLKQKGYNPQEAAQIAAKYHGDYASVPAETRKWLNRFFFTPTFKIAMGKLYGRMIADSIKYTFKLGAVDPTTKAYARGVIGTAAVVFGFDLFMTEGLGFKRDQFGRRYAKEIETDEGTKELVVTWSTPANMFLKYLYRAKSSMGTGVENPIKSFIEQNKWEVHPVYRTAYDIYENKNGIGDKIYSEFEKYSVIGAAKTLKYAVTNIVQILSAFDEQPSSKKANEKFAEETSELLQILSRPFMFKYMRNVDEKRAASKLNALKDRFRSEMYQNLKNGREPITDDMRDSFVDQIHEIMDEYKNKKK